MSKELDTLTSQVTVTVAAINAAIAGISNTNPSDGAQLTALAGQLSIATDALNAAFGGKPPVLSVFDQNAKDVAKAAAVASGMSTYSWVDSNGVSHPETV